MKMTRILAVLAVAGLFAGYTQAVPADPLETGFLNPPDSAKPQTWWHWMNGNITKAGITADLEAMKQIGLGGATIVNVGSGIPAGSVPFMSPEWREDFKFAMQEANRLGLDMCVENCAGWSSSGGPWNTVSNAMQHVTTSEVRVTGPTHFSAALPQPPTTLDYYRDIAVLAFPAPADESVRMKDFSPVASASSKTQPGDRLTDADESTVFSLLFQQDGPPQYVQLTFTQPYAARTVKIIGGKGIGTSAGEILVSDDGKKFRKLQTFMFGRHDAITRTISLGTQPVVARFWRVQFTKTESKSIGLAEIDLTPRLTIENIDKKAGVNDNIVLSSSGSDAAVAGAIQRESIIDLTHQLAADGKLNWQVPAGNWVILRVGYTPTGANNHPAPVEGTGLECDKFSKAALDAHWDGFMQKVLDDIGPLAGKSLNSSLIDSYEVGGQNWNQDFRAAFAKRRGYDPLKFLPAFTARLVENPEVSERFLWDVRRTIADLIAENYFGHFAELCKAHGLQNAVEPYTGPFESMQSGAPADVVMGEFWSGSKGHSSIKLVSSIAHIYGKTIVGAESFTANPKNAGRWQEDPYSLKALGDLMYCQGLNRYVFHRYAMQPWTNRWPGMTMGQWGFHFERTETWWNQGKPWIDYISHCEFLLQQGRSVQDAAYFTGESAPVMARVNDPALPQGYDYDAVNSDVLHGATVKNGRITLASGANYAVLILPPTDINMRPKMLACLRDLVRAGATVVGPRPEHSPSLADYPQADAQVKNLAAEIWGNCDGKNILENAVGQGRMVWGKPLADIFAAQNLKPDFEFTSQSTDTQLAYVHRISGAADIYFVSNQRREFDSAECIFRVSGKVPELWNAETGRITKAPVWHELNGRTVVSLAFEPAGSVFVVFRGSSMGNNHVVSAKSLEPAHSAVPPQLKILRARYEAIDSEAGADVTARLTSLVNNGTLNIIADAALFGDPAKNHHKRLRVEFTLNGKRGEQTVKEHELLAIGLAGPAASPAYELAVGEDGNMFVTAQTACDVELKTAAGKTLTTKVRDVPPPIELSGSWNLSFPPNWGAPVSVTLDRLISWTSHPVAGVRYFSGTATYEKDIEISAERLSAGRELWLDLGEVKNFAEVFFNGQSLGVLWKPPFRINLTAAAKPGANKLEIKVTNLWPNRLIGDEQLPPDCEWNGLKLKAWPQWLLDGKPSPTGRLTFTTWHHWTKGDALLESGLLGPVTLSSAVKVPMN